MVNRSEEKVRVHVHMNVGPRSTINRVFYISQVFSNDWSVLSQRNTRLRLLHLLYDIDFTRAKQ